ncbi:MAG: DNA polymerase III subunit beta [Pseudobdellovibrionaceae bacterium]
MKLEIDKKDLMSLIGKTQNIVEKRNTMPVLVNVLLQAEGKTVRVFATDLEVSLTDEAPAKVLTPGKVAVNTKNLFDIIKELSDGPIKLTKRENNWLEISQNKYNSKIVGISAEEYPVFPTYTGHDFLKLESNVLQDMIDKTIYSVSTDETRYHLNGVYFERFNKKDNGQTAVQREQSFFRMVATDGHRLSLIEKATDEGMTALKDSAGVIIPRKGLHEIKKLVESLDGEFEMAIEGSQLIVRHSSTVLMIRLIEGKYPNYQQLIPANLSRKVSVDREAFLTSLKRVSPVANQKSKGVTLLLSNGKMEISSNNPELGDAKDEIEIDYKGGDLKIGFNAKYITDILNSIHDETIELELNDQLSPGLVRPQNDKNYTCVIMPMRI